MMRAPTIKKMLLALYSSMPCASSSWLRVKIGSVDPREQAVIWQPAAAHRSPALGAIARHNRHQLLARDLVPVQIQLSDARRHTNGPPKYHPAPAAQQASVTSQGQRQFPAAGRAP